MGGRQLIRPELSHTVRVVLTLVQGLENKGFDLYIDQFYNSPLVTTELLKIGVTVTGIYEHTPYFVSIFLIIRNSTIQS